jgi:ABC-type transport system involved in multi-copper enzyme maturation permease subunit
VKDFIRGTHVILELELRQRVRTVAWYVLIGVFVVLVALVTAAVSFAMLGFGNKDSGGAVFSTVIYFVLLLGTLVTPALSGNVINGDRDAGTLATTQVTLITTWQLLIGKFLAAWITALTFLGAATPFLIYATFVGGLGADTVLVAILVLAVELGVVAAIGVGLSGLLPRPLFSIVLTYLAVAALSIGTLIAFSLLGLVTQVDVRYETNTANTYDVDGNGHDCGPLTVSVSRQPRFDIYWGVLVANPYVLLADAVPTHYSSDGYPTDLFGEIKWAVRSSQLPPQTTYVYDECNPSADAAPTAREVIGSTTPGWLVGLILHLLLAAGALLGAWARTKTPAGRLSRGSRVA